MKEKGLEKLIFPTPFTCLGKVIVNWMYNSLMQATESRNAYVIHLQICHING
jgi:hypothetical protein